MGVATSDGLANNMIHVVELMESPVGMSRLVWIDPITGNFTFAAECTWNSSVVLREMDKVLLRLYRTGKGPLQDKSRRELIEAGYLEA